MDERGATPGEADLLAKAEALRAQGDEEGARKLEATARANEDPGSLPINPAQPVRTVLVIAAQKDTAAEVFDQLNEKDKQRIHPGDLP